MSNTIAVVTGGTGFVGSFLVERLLEKGVTVRVPHREEKGFLAEREADVEWHHGDIADIDFCKELLRGADSLYHLASFRKNIAFHKEHAEEVKKRNIAMTEALINSLEPQTHVTFFSTAIVGVLDDADDIADGYVAGKVHCEKRWQEAVEDLLIVRPANIYGPRDRFAEDGNVIPALMVRASHATDALAVWGTGKQERPFVFVEDVVSALNKLEQENVTGTHYIVPPENISIGDLSTYIKDIVNPALKIEFDTAKPEGPSFPVFEVHECLADFAWTPLQKGLQKTVEWWHAQGNLK